MPSLSTIVGVKSGRLGKHGANHGRLGHRLLHDGHNATIGLRGAELAMESRTIVREYAPDALPVHGHAHGGGVHREVSAFGMTTHVQRAGRQLGNIVYICGSLLLGGNRDSGRSC